MNYVGELMVNVIKIKKKIQIEILVTSIANLRG